MSDCKSCKEHNNPKEPIPYLAYESTMVRMERTIKRLWIILIIIVTMLVATNAFWIWQESQYEDVVTTTESYTAQSDNGGNAIISGNGGVSVNGDS